jgi:pimeloyl-ACP methyl ester carboxylesterase
MANSARVWDTVVPMFTPRAEVWSADLPWRGDAESTWSHHSDPAHWISDVFGAVAGGVDVVVAHSFSAILVMELLARYGADGFRGLRGAVLVSPFFRREPEEFRFELIGTLVHNFELAMREGIRTQISRRIDEDLHAEMARLVCERVGPYGWMRFLEAYLRTPWLPLDLISLPCTTIAGTDDRTAPAGEAQVLADLLPNARAALLDGCGHFPMTEQPAQFAAQVDMFIDTLTVPAGTAVPVTGGRPL